MRISSVALGLILTSIAPSLAGAGATPFQSTKEALHQGISAYQGGYYEIAVPALEYAAAEKEFMADYYLARIYSDNTGAYTDHAKAYMIFERIVDAHLDVDPDDDPRAPFVGKALTALAGYVRRGLPEIGLKPDSERAVFFLKNASTTFNDEDAQFELAKLHLKGEGMEANVPLGRHWLSILSQNGHAGAQAFFADLLWHGKYMDADPARALALISIAVENAPPHERLWIEDIYQDIYCGAGEGTRRQATGIVAQWGSRYGRKPENRDRTGLGQLVSGPERRCSNGEAVAPIHNLNGKGAFEALPVTADSVPQRSETRSFSYGSAAGPNVHDNLRDVGAVLPPAAAGR